MPHNKMVPLTQIKAGSTVRVVKIEGGKDATHKLAELGLLPGILVRVLQDTGGPMLLAVRDSQLALGRGIAAKLKVVPTEG